MDHEVLVVTYLCGYKSSSASINNIQLLLLLPFKHGKQVCRKMYSTLTSQLKNVIIKTCYNTKIAYILLHTHSMSYIVETHTVRSYIILIHTRDGRYQKFDVDAISICKASINQYITIFLTILTFSLNLCKFIKYTAFCFKFLCFGDLNLPLLLKAATLWNLLLPRLTSNPKKTLICDVYFLII